LRNRAAIGVALLIAGLAAPTGVNAAPLPEPCAKSLLYRIDRTDTTPSWLFGTMHSPDPRVAVSPAVAAALYASRQIAPEIEFDAAAVAALAAAMVFADGPRLSDYFDQATLARIQAGLAPIVFPPEVFVRLKPWAVMLLLSVPADMGRAPVLDQILVEEARRRGLTVAPLEPGLAATAAFEAIPIETQIVAVEQALAHLPQRAALMERTLQAWLAGDLDRLYDIVTEPGRSDPKIARHLDIVIYQLHDVRSLAMADRLREPLRGGRVFVAVGAIHLHGPNGLLAQIRAQGYKVQPVC